jgi:hypothetical protein
VQISVNSGGPQQGGLTVAGASTIQLSLTNISLLTSVRWEIYAYPPSWPTPSGWTLDASTGIIYSTDTTPALITLEASSVRWGKWLVRCIGNGGTKNGVPPVSDPITGSYLPNDVIDIASGWQVLSPNHSLVDVALYEGTQFGALLRWVAGLQTSLRQIDGITGGGGGSSIVQHAGQTGDYTVTETSGIVYVGFKTFAAPHTLTVPAAPGSPLVVIAYSEDDSITDTNTLTWTAGGTVQFERANTSATTFVQNRTTFGKNGKCQFHFDGLLYRADS